MLQEDLLAKIQVLREEYKRESDPVKRKIIENRARLLKHTSYYKKPNQKEIKWS